MSLAEVYMPIVITNISGAVRERETSPFVSMEHNLLFLEEFLRVARINRVLVLDILYVGEKLQIYIEDTRSDWADYCDVTLYDEQGDLIQRYN